MPVTQPGLVPKFLRVTGEVVCHMRGCVYLPVSPSSSSGMARCCSQHGGRRGRGLQAAPLPGCQSDLLGPFKSSRPSGRHRGVIPACPGWTRVEPMLTSGTRPVGPIRPPRAPAPPTRLRGAAQPPSWRLGRGPRQAEARTHATGPSAERPRALPQFPMLRGCAHPDGPLSVWGLTRVCWGGASQDIPREARPALRPLPSLCPGNSRWQGEQICCPLERSRGKCC